MAGAAASGARKSRSDFKRLNREWIETWFALEEGIARRSTTRSGRVVAPGGQNLFVVDGAEVLGTARRPGIGRTSMRSPRWRWPRRRAAGATGTC